MSTDNSRDNIAGGEYELLKRSFEAAGVPHAGYFLYEDSDSCYSAGRPLGCTNVRLALRLPSGTTLCFDADGKFLGTSGAHGLYWTPRHQEDAHAHTVST